MKRLLFLLAAVVLVGSFALAQTRGTAAMINAKHDLRVTSTKTNAQYIAGASDALCSYCHTPHVPAAGIKVPLWARAAKDTNSWGIYSSSTMDVTPVDPSNPTSGQHKNVSNMCLSCHDGSAMYTSAAYVKRPDVQTGWSSVETRAVQDIPNRDRNRIVGGTDYTNLSHTHPVNFNYAAAVSADGALHTAATAGYVHLDGTTRVGRLFDGKVQCSSCHNPHMTDTKMIQGTLTDGKLCVACHAK